MHFVYLISATISLVFAITFLGARKVGAIDVNSYLSNSENQIRSVALIEGIRNDRPDKRLTATGVLVDLDSTSRFVFLLTNRHVWNATVDSFQITFRSFQHPSDSQVGYSEPICVLPSTRAALMPHSDDSDFALIPLQRNTLGDSISSVNIQQMLSCDQIQAGTEVLYYGYPMRDKGIFAGAFRPPLCRRGTISTVLREDIHTQNGKRYLAGTVLIDGVSLGGNSGGPVFAVSQKFETSGDSYLYFTDRKLVGIILGHYQDSTLPVVPTNRDSTINFEVTRDSQEPRNIKLKYSKGFAAISDPNYNLALVLPIDVVIEYYQLNKLTIQFR